MSVHSPSKITKSMRAPIKWLALFSVASNLLLLAAPIHMLQVYDRVLTSQSRETLLYVTAITIAAISIYGLAEMVRGIIAQRLSARFTSQYSEGVFKSSLTSKLSLAEKSKVVRDLNTVRSFLASRSAIGLFDLPFAPFFIILLFILHTTLGMLGLIGAILLILATYMNKKLAESHRLHSEQSSSEASGFAQAVLSRSDDILAMGLLPSLMQRWGKMTVNLINSADTVTKYSSFFYGLGKFLRQSLQVGVMAWGAYLVLEGDLSGGVIFASSMILGRALMPIEQLLGGWDGTVNAYHSYKAIQSAENSLDRTQRIELPQALGHVAVQNLLFDPASEHEAPPILDGINFDLDPGNILVVVGASGSGKSTLARLMVGAEVPTAGNVRIDGFDLAQWPDYQRAEAIGYVPQDILLFPGTIADNIARMHPNPDDAKVIHAAKLAGVHELVATLPQGYGTVVGSGGVRLSGGQRQRIALARAFYDSPKILVLDEPNAHLDRESEKLLMTALLNAKNAGVAIMCITQRKSMLKIADYVLALSKGKVASYSKNNPEANFNLGKRISGPTPQKAGGAGVAAAKAAPIGQSNMPPPPMNAPVAPAAASQHVAAQKSGVQPVAATQHVVTQAAAAAQTVSQPAAAQPQISVASIERQPRAAPPAAPQQSPQPAQAPLETVGNYAESAQQAAPVAATEAAIQATGNKFAQIAQSVRDQQETLKQAMSDRTAEVQADLQEISENMPVDLAPPTPTKPTTMEIEQTNTPPISKDLVKMLRQSSGAFGRHR